MNHIGIDMKLSEIKRHYPTQEHCIHLLYELRWDYEPICPHCDSTFVDRILNNVFNGREQYRCGDCNKTYSITTKTIFHHTQTPLAKWFTAIHIIKTAKRLPTCPMLANLIDVSLKVAQTMRSKIVADFETESSLCEQIYQYNRQYELH